MDHLKVQVKRDNYTSNESFTLEFNDIDQDIKRLSSTLKSKGVTMDEFMLWMNNSSLFTHYYLSRKENGFTISVAHSQSGLVYFLRHIAGNNDENLKESNDILKDAGIYYDTLAYELQVGNIKIKQFKNGRLDLTGLTPEQDAQINRMIELRGILR